MEHDLKWVNIVEERIRNRNIKNVDLNSVSRENDEYSNFINKFENDYFDLIFIDGRDRVKCIKNSIAKLKPGGILVLDNSERDRYNAGKRLLRNWKTIETTNTVWRTTIWFKPTMKE